MPMPTGEVTPWEVAGAVPDPELPALTLADLGVLRSAKVDDSGHVEVRLTPTYSGCPALEVMRHDVLSALKAAGYPDATVGFDLAPAWSTDQLGPDGRSRLEAAGIAPPAAPGTALPLVMSLKCPRCGSIRTREISRFGATACKSLWRCTACQEPFEHFKVLR
jgi:ring-1,2-phenylacetyl-CoA epoxidase subunit PaaD